MSRSRVQTSWLLISPPSWNWPLSTSSFFFSIIDLDPLQYSCLENPMDGGACWAAAHGVAKSQTWLSDFPFTFHFHALEKEMATPGGLQSMGSQRVRHDWATSLSLFTFMHWRRKWQPILGNPRMSSLTQWTWVWVDSASWWWTGRPGMLQSMGSQRVGHDWATKLNWTEARWWL